MYTIGSWRVSREMYLFHLSRLGVRMLVDVRGNPKAGRQEDLHRGKELSRALQSAGIRYEYWGDKFGEDQEGNQDDSDLHRGLKGMLATVAPGPLCLLGHLHEPNKCHRLRLCSLLPPDWTVVHITWPDHSNIRLSTHAEELASHSADEGFFWAAKEREAQKRIDERSTRRSGSSNGRWKARGGGSSRGGSEAHAEAEEVAAAVSAAANAAASLPTLVWADTPEDAWEDALRDGEAYRILLPWDTELLWYPRFFSQAEADDLERLTAERVTLYHPTYEFQTPSGVTEEKINRKGQGKICDDFSFNVQYSAKRNVTYEVMKFQPWSWNVLKRVEAASESVFNTVWVNHYRDGTVTIHWHTDGDEGLGPNPIIGSVSLGSARMFSFKSKRPLPAAPGRTAQLAHISVPLFHGSLLVMGKNSQTHWLHAVPAMEGVKAERTNLTFRFYAHKDLQVSKQDTPVKTDQKAAEGKGGEESAEDSLPSRFRLVPGEGAWAGICDTVRPLVVDAPASAACTASEFARKVGEAIMPAGAEEFVLAVPCPLGGDAGGHRLLGPSDPVLPALRCREGDCPYLLFLPPASKRASSATQPASSSRAVGAAGAVPPGYPKKPGGAGTPDCPEDLRRELVSLPVPPYAPPNRAAAEVALGDGGDWIREVLTGLSGIQRKSKGKAQVSRSVFHQSSEFLALYVGRPKSTVHLVVSPARLLRRRDAGPAHAPLLRRLAAYAAHLLAGLRQARPDLRFAAGLRTRPGSAQQLHAHLVSLDFQSPFLEDFQRRHWEDFTSGPSAFLPLTQVADLLESGQGLPNAADALPAGSARPLVCHRCGHLFGDAFNQLCQHLRRCDDWPAEKEASPGPDASAMAQLEEMGFGVCGQEALRNALETGGSVERAIAMLVVP